VPASASLKSATFVTVIAFSVGATAPSNANRAASAAVARMLSRRQNQRVQQAKRAAKTAAAAGTVIQKTSTAS
jgi:ABC-type transporter MlaC component